MKDPPKIEYHKYESHQFKGCRESILERVGIASKDLLHELWSNMTILTGKTLSHILPSSVL
jgi:hypothetical protein